MSLFRRGQKFSEMQTEEERFDHTAVLADVTAAGPDPASNANLRLA